MNCFMLSNSYPRSSWLQEGVNVVGGSDGQLHPAVSLVHLHAWYPLLLELSPTQQQPCLRRGPPCPWGCTTWCPPWGCILTRQIIEMVEVSWMRFARTWPVSLGEGGVWGVLELWNLTHHTHPGGKVQRVAHEDNLVLHNEEDRLVWNKFAINGNLLHIYIVKYLKKKHFLEPRKLCNPHSVKINGYI